MEKEKIISIFEDIPLKDAKKIITNLKENLQEALGENPKILQIIVDKEWKYGIIVVKVKDGIYIISYAEGLRLISKAPTQKEKVGNKILNLTVPVLKKKTSEYQSQKIISKESERIENSEKFFNDFIKLFEEKLKNGVDRLNKGKNYTNPVLELFRENTIFKGTVFGKAGKGKDYAQEYFREFIKKKPVKVEVTDKQIITTQEGIATKGTYTFTLENGDSIQAAFLILIAKDEKGPYFKLFHSTLEKDLVKF